MIPANVGWGNAVGSGTTGPFAIPFKLYSQSHLTVLQVNVTVPTSPVVTTMNLGTDYTFTSWSPDNKGQVSSPAITFTNAVAAGILIIFLLVLPQTQLTSFTSGPYSPGATEAADDILTQMCQQLWQWAGKTIKAPDWESAGLATLNLPSVAVRQSKALGFDANGNIAMLQAAPTGSIIFTSTGQILAAIASITSLLQLLGVFYLANQAAVLAQTPNVGQLNIAYQVDTGKLWYYNFVDAAWENIAVNLPQ